MGITVCLAVGHAGIAVLLPVGHAGIAVLLPVGHAGIVQEEDQETVHGLHHDVQLLLAHQLQLVLSMQKISSLFPTPKLCFVFF